MDKLIFVAVRSTWNDTYSINPLCHSF